MSKLISRETLSDLDFKKLGLVCGLEIHQQLDTGKLFCKCPSQIVSNEKLDKEVLRKLRFSLGESGGVDKAALSEFKKGKYNLYKYNDTNACLVDLDEEPPKGPNCNALKTAIGVSKMFNLKFFDKLVFMRKLIVDGSVTSGFQRTAMLGLGGEFETKNGVVGIDAISLEEDSCRVIERNENHTVFSLDRQGIPLIEITTAPHIHSPDQAFEAAKYIGNVLRSFDKVKRGLGTIRQDLNVSIKGGARVEIKGAQNLKLIPDIVSDEVRRQKIHLSIIDELKNKGINSHNFSDKKVYDVTGVFDKSKSRVIRGNLREKGSKIFAVKLFGFKGILKHEMQKGYRFATEISDRNKKHFPQIKGLFHLDELPNYGITQREVNEVKKHLGVKGRDSFILIASNDSGLAKKSIRNVFNIIHELIRRVPSEVRWVDPKGTVTNFLRPMPGAARMYPETDIVEVELSSDMIGGVEVPQLYSEKLMRIEMDWNLESLKIAQVLDRYSEFEINEFLRISEKSASTLYSILFDIPKDIKKRDGVEPVDFKYELLLDLLKEVRESNLNQKAVRDIFLSLYKDKKSHVDNLKEYLEKRNLLVKSVDVKEVEEKIKEIVKENKGAPFGALMGKCMQAFNGKMDGKLVSEILKKLVGDSY